MDTKPQFVFFGTPDLVVSILDRLKDSDYIPKVIVTMPDKPQGRKMTITPPSAKVWAEKNNIPVLQPERLDQNFIDQLKTFNIDLGIVVAYGKIMPERLLTLPKFGMINVHYSLLPKYRGATPVEATILSGDSETGVAIQQMQYILDSGPILSLQKVSIDPNEKAFELRERLNSIAGNLLIEILKKIQTNTTQPEPQDDSLATHTAKIKKSDGEITPELSDEEKSRRFRAYYGWPGSYFIHPKAGRVKITDADLENGVFIIKKVIPEGKKEMSYETFLKSYSN